MKKILFFGTMFMMSIALIFTGCKKDDDEPMNKYAQKIAAKYFWGYAEEGYLTNGDNNYCELEVLSDGMSAVLSAEGEAPMTLKFTFDDKGNITVSGTDNAFFGKVNDLKVEVSESGDKVTISGTSNFTDRGREGDYVLVLKLEDGPQSAYYEKCVMGKTFEANWDNLAIIEIERAGEADMMDLVFDKKEHTLVLTTAGECPMTINWKVDSWNNFTLEPVNRTWKVGDPLVDGLSEDAWWDPSKPAFDYYGKVDEGWYSPSFVVRHGNEAHQGSGFKMHFVGGKDDGKWRTFFEK